MSTLLKVAQMSGGTVALMSGGTYDSGTKVAASLVTAESSINWGCMLTQQTTCTVWTFNQDIVCRIVNGKPTNINIWNSRRLYWWRQICLFYRFTINIFRLKWGWITSKKKPEEKKSINESFWEILIFVLFPISVRKLFL